MTELERIADRVANTPLLAVAEAEEDRPASVYEVEDGLPALCYLPGEYSQDWQNMLAKDIVQAYADRATLLGEIAKMQRQLEEVAQYVVKLEAVKLNSDPEDYDYPYWQGRMVTRQKVTEHLRKVLDMEEGKTDG